MTDPKRSRAVLLWLLALLGIGAIAGGGALIFSPLGKLLGMPLSMLDHSPFRSFLVPGLILFFVLGLLPCLLIFALVKKPDSTIAERFNGFKDMHWSWSLTVYVAFALIIWIQLEMLFLQAVHWLHTAYTALALAILITALMPQLRLFYKKQNYL